MAPVLSSLSNNTNSFSISRSFSSSDIVGDAEFDSMVPVMGLIAAPEEVVRLTLEEAVSFGGALSIPLWNRNPATLP
jgi:spore maturation protein SpmB